MIMNKLKGKTFENSRQNYGKFLFHMKRPITFIKSAYRKCCNVFYLTVLYLN